MDLNSIGKNIIKYLLVGLGFAIFILGIMFLNHSYTEAGQLSINLQTAISSFMLCSGIGFCFIAFKHIK